jgi:hypothetical protein
VTDLPRDPDSAGDRGSRPGLTEESTPSWVKAFGIVGLVLVLLILIALLSGHGPGRHMPFNHHLDKHTPAAARAQ